MQLTTSGLFVLACIGLGVWFKKDNSFRKREFIAVSVFWILALATPFGATAATKFQSMLGTGVKTATETVNSVSQ
ncbi:hypothetical protein [Streptomyces sp. NRRL S-1868]|uniref:hypothetical protein n=1 Tax=Streptomyces sp. NRRL S-1868 TaxID=1463892 RepID=UPI0004C4E238|nr:hypothetical protein [Streptomyces sp. NRRL S-1868]